MTSKELPPPPQRLTSIDAYRGFVMFLMLAEVLHFHRVATAVGDNPVLKFLDHHQTHVAWVGCTLHDLIQPSFSFLVGVALPFSLASRVAKGQSRGRMILHAVWRASVLVWLGIFLRSLGSRQTNYTFEDTLTQIGLGYLFLFLLGMRSARDQWIALVVILVGYWAAFVWYRFPDPGTAAKVNGVARNSRELLSGFSAHWNKNQNVAWAFDHWFLNHLPRKEPFLFNSGGYSTLSFIPTLGTMILGLLAGGVLKSDWPAWRKVGWLAVAGAVSLAAGWVLGELGICPVVKRIWTPSWVLFSGGWCFLILGLSYALIDVAGWRGWVFPLVVIGANSIAAYMMNALFERFIEDRLKVHLGRDVFLIFGKAYEPLVVGVVVLGIYWLILFAMYRKRILVKV
jgi:heparan-alpha-glucosaminide N-acetyltransferase